MKFIYGLFDPRDESRSICYVGCTGHGLTTRLSAHIAAAMEDQQAPVMEWIRSLLREDEEPMILLLERVKDDRWEERERFWIERYAGPKLFNVARGGRGSPGVSKPERVRKAIGDQFRGKPLNEQHKERISASKQGHAVDQETREKIAASLSGRKQSEETKARRKATLAQLGYKHTEEARARISAARKGSKLGPISDEAKAKLRASIGALVWITDGKTSRRVNKAELIPEGWRAGRA